MKRVVIWIIGLSSPALLVAQEITRYDLRVTDTLVNYTGKTRHAIAINGSIPAPVLYFTEGDTAEIYIHNLTREETSIHLHGLLVPNRLDGVPYLTTPPVRPGQTLLYRFKIVQHGTYWYHSHTRWQEQSGMYGPIIIYKKGEKPVKEVTLLLSDWTNEKPYEVDRSLHTGTDWYAIRKGSTQDYWQAAKMHYLRTKITGEWKRMLPMDVSDVRYDRFFANGKSVVRSPDWKAGDSVRLRIVNGSSSTYFWLQFAGGAMTVIASDGKEVEPVRVGRLLIAVAETYDILVTLPENRSYELRATAEDRTGAASVFLGNGPPVIAPVLQPLKYFEGMKMINSMMDMNGNMKNRGMQMSDQTMDMNNVMYPELSSERGLDSMGPGQTSNRSLNYGMLRSPSKTVLPEGPVRTFRFELTGNMNRYVWSINNKTVSQADKILIKKGERIRILLTNATMMRHPMHLHGHFFRVLNGQGDYAPLKNTLDIMPMETDTLEFAASESGNWFFHCHILYHMMSGMGRIFSYEMPLDSMDRRDEKMAFRMVYMDDRMIHPAAQIGLESNGSDGEIDLSGTRARFQTEWRIGLNSRSGYESESHIGRYFGRMQYWFAYAGWDFRYRTSDTTEKTLFGQTDTKNNRKVACAGLQYILPMLVVADARIDMQGKFRLQLSRENIALTSRLRLSFMVNSDKEYMAGFRYVISKYFALSTHYDSDMKFGAGIALIY